MPFVVGAAFFVVMVSWRIGRGYLADVVDSESDPIDVFLHKIDALALVRIPGTAIVMASRSKGVPPVLVRLLSRFAVLHEHVVLVTVLTEHVPTVDASKRLTIEPIGKGLVRVLLRYGFMERPNVPEGLHPALVELGLAAGSTMGLRPAEPGSAPCPGAPLYVLGAEHLIVGEKGRMGRLTESVFAFLARNARSVTDDFSLPVEQVVEIGMELDL